MSDRAIKEMLAEYIEQQSAWRKSKAEEYPDDKRNERSAHGLTNLADYVRGLPDGELLLLLDAVHDDFGTGVFLPGEHTSREVSRYHFNDPSETPDAFLKRLHDALVEDTMDRLREDDQ